VILPRSGMPTNCPSRKVFTPASSSCSPRAGRTFPPKRPSRFGEDAGAAAPAVTVRLAAFGEDAPLRFDVNTVQEGILRLVPGISEDEIARWTAERAKAPFSSAEDFRRSVLPADTLAGMKL